MRSYEESRKGMLEKPEFKKAYDEFQPKYDIIREIIGTGRNATECNILATMKIDNNTAVVTDGPRNMFRIGMSVLDENGKPFRVLSVGMDNILVTENMAEKTALLLEGQFS